MSNRYDFVLVMKKMRMRLTIMYLFETKNVDLQILVHHNNAYKCRVEAVKTDEGEWIK